MSLRSRLAFTVGLVTLAIVALLIGSTRFVAGRVLEQSLDTQLLTEAERFGGQISRDRPGSRNLGQSGNSDPLAVRTGFAQVIDGNGTIVRAGLSELTIPIDEVDTMVAEGRARPRLRSLTIDDTDYRVLTRQLPARQQKLAVQVAITSQRTNDSLRGFSQGLVILGGLGVLAAAIAGYIIASRIARPVEQLAEAANDVARTRDFSQRITVNRSDEVGNLATSFNSMLSKLEQSKMQQHQLVQDASHELRTPLTSVRTNIDVLGANIDKMSHSQRDEVLQELQSEVGELSLLVGELVGLATDTDADSSPPAEVDLASLASATAQRFGRLHDRHISTEGRAQAVAVVDRDLVERALVNLVTNAIKFSRDGTAIAVRVDSVGDEIRVEVADNGPGIPDDDLSRIFDRFYRSDTTRTMSGSGLGLAMVAQAAQRHAGTVWARNNDEQGATVGFSVGSSAHQ